jgi:hypothetical protein
LQELGRGKATLLDESVEIVGKVDLHARHTPNYTPSSALVNVRSRRPFARPTDAVVLTWPYYLMR